MNIIFGVVSNKAKEATSGAQNSKPAQWHLATEFLLGPRSSPMRTLVNDEGKRKTNTPKT